MTSTSNGQAIARMYGSFLSNDSQLELSAFTEHSVWTEPEGNVRAGVFTGTRAIVDHVRDCMDQTDGTWGTDVQEILSGDRYVVVVERALGLRNGTSLNMLCNTVYEMADGAIVEMRVLPFDREAWDAFWS